MLVLYNTYYTRSKLIFNTISGSVEQSNLVKMRNSNLGQSAPSLTASLVGFILSFLPSSYSGFSKYTIDGATESSLLYTSATYTYTMQLTYEHYSKSSTLSKSRFGLSVSFLILWLIGGNCFRYETKKKNLVSNVI